MPNVLIIGATRGLGASLANAYASRDNNTVFGTTRSAHGPESDGLSRDIHWVPNIDLTSPDVGGALTNQLGQLGVGNDMVEGGIKGFDVVIITAGYFFTEDFTVGPQWEEEIKMYTTSSVAPPFIVHALFRAHFFSSGSRVILVSSESGSITLRHETEGGGNYGHHASKAALNMVGKLLSLDLRKSGVIVSIVHPGFMRTDMTKGVGFDKFWDDGGAVTPDEAATSLVEWISGLDMAKTGQYWAPRGPADIGTAEAVLGKGLSKPLRLPW
ncbi:MAG: hypothetical protein M1818_008297 [Claussenomyces sp. TS43310]|nr:MAG: hypothetical protein M1818_008297 [Claussenomyces sp. TS43310]